jgi:hypothetical protein
MGDSSSIKRFADLGLEAGLKQWFKGEYQYPKRLNQTGVSAGYMPQAA